MASSLKLKRVMFVVFILISLKIAFRPTNASPILVSVLVVEPNASIVKMAEISPRSTDSDVEDDVSSNATNEMKPTTEHTINLIADSDSTTESSYITDDTDVHTNSTIIGDDGVHGEECIKPGCNLKKDRSGIICCKWYPQIGRWLIQYTSPPCREPNWFYKVTKACIEVHVPKNSDVQTAIRKSIIAEIFRVKPRPNPRGRIIRTRKYE